MNLNDIVKANAANQYLEASASTQTTGGLSLVAQAGLKKADQRIQAQVGKTTAQLSTFGKLPSAVSGTQIAARGLGILGSTSTAAVQKSTARDFASAFNAATQELASNGNVGLSLSTLNQRSGILKSQQATLNALGQGANPTQSNTGFGSWTNWGFSAYQQSS